MRSGSWLARCAAPTTTGTAPPSAASPRASPTRSPVPAPVRPTGVRRPTLRAAASRRPSGAPGRGPTGLGAVEGEALAAHAQQVAPGADADESAVTVEHGQVV